MRTKIAPRTSQNRSSKQMAPHHDVLLAFLMICSSSNIFSMVFHSQKAEASKWAMASLKHCERKCGGMEIPYPFGMKEGCYLDQTFEVTCNESTRSASLANWLPGEVDSISISSHSLRHKGFVARTLQFNKSSGESEYGHYFNLDYLGSNYFISHNKNKFVAKGCDFYAYLVDEETKELLGGCAPLCNRGDIVPSSSSSCSGLDCCQINIPKDLRNLTLNVDTINTLTKSWECGLFTFVDMNFPLNKINFSACEDMYTVPVIYEWTVGTTSCKEAMGGDDYVCGHNTDCDDIPGMGYRCRCRNGYRGNPYLTHGCQDIDECADPTHNHCPMENTCVNTRGSYSCEPNQRRVLAMIIKLGISLAVGLLVLVTFGLWVWWKLKKIHDRKTKQRFFKRNGGLLLQEQISSNSGSVLPDFTLFMIEELEKATDKFSESRILGKGGLGTVYKGMLSDGRIVAVKKANITEDSRVSQFINEVLILSQINHRHIVKLLGCCLETEVPLIVYEYVSNGTLSHHIHDEPNISTISWENRLRIAAEVAGALAYLHSCASTAIFHRDIKSSNILLDENYKAVVSDFGLSRSVSIDKTHLTTLVGGTFGYLDPEYFRSGQLNDKSDVYAFGVVLAEILTGQKPVSSVKDDIGLALRFRSAVKEHCLFEILEKAVVYEGQKEEILAVAKLAKRCLKLNARKRPSMKEVAAELDQLRKTKEFPGHQQSFRDDQQLSISEYCLGSGIDSEEEDDQANVVEN